MTDFARTLAGLKHSLQQATDLSDPWERFHDEVAMEPSYSFSGQVERNSRIECVLTATAAHLLRRRCTIGHAHFVHLAEHHFWHGHCEIGPRTVIFFFFDDIDVGLAGYFRAITDPQVELARLTVLELQDVRTQSN